MQFPYRLAAIDLDETLLGPDHLISDRNREAVTSLARAGVTCVIASGRMHEATTRFADELGLAEPIISYNGSMVKHYGSKEVWLHMRVPSGPAGEVARFCEQNHRHLNYYLNDRLYVSQTGYWAEFYVKQTGSPMEKIDSLLDLIGTEPTKMILIDSPGTVDRLLSEFRDQYGDSLYITKTNPEYLEFMNPSANKGRALELVADRLRISRKETLAFGDGNNDLPMIQWAGLGVAMGGARANVRGSADIVAPPFEEDGLAAAIEQLMSISMPVLGATASPR